MMKKKILIVDDSSTSRMLLKVCFSDNPQYDIIEAKDWKTALEIAQSEHPFMIILDYNMPEKTGGDVARMLQHANVKAHYVLLTANTQPSIIQEIKELGFLDVIEKPVSVESVQALLDKAK